MGYAIETELEDDGRWIAEVVAIPGVMCYGDSCDDAIANAKELMARVMAERNS